MGWLDCGAHSTSLTYRGEELGTAAVFEGLVTRATLWVIAALTPQRLQLVSNCTFTVFPHFLSHRAQILSPCRTVSTESTFYLWPSSILVLTVYFFIRHGRSGSRLFKCLQSTAE